MEMAAYHLENPLPLIGSLVPGSGRFVSFSGAESLPLSICAKRPLLHSPGHYKRLLRRNERLRKTAPISSFPISKRRMYIFTGRPPPLNFLLMRIPRVSRRSFKARDAGKRRNERSCGAQKEKTPWLLRPAVAKMLYPRAAQVRASIHLKRLPDNPLFCRPRAGRLPAQSGDRQKILLDRR